MKLTEFDSNKKAFFNPEDIETKIDGCPKTLITCFSHKIIEAALRLYDYEIIGGTNSSNGYIPLYKLNIGGKSIGLIMTMIGSPSAVAQYEELFAMGIENIIVFGTCGVLDNKIEDCSIIIPDKAVRDEGTSFHYAPSSDEINVNVKSLDKMINFFASRNIKYVVGKAWTTDAIYRETADKVKKRKEEKCICVDMECSAIAALAQFRNKNIAQFFYAADNLDAEKWESRSLLNDSMTDVKMKILKLTVELAQEID